VPAGQNDEKTVVLLHLDEAEGSTSFVNSAEAATNPADPVTAHEDRRDNPHEVTKAQVDLTNVTDDAQLKRAAGDIATFPEKATPVAADKVLLEDSADSGAKKWAEVQNLPAGGTGAPTTAEYIVGAMDATLSAERLIQGPSGGGNETQGVKVDLATGGACKLIGLSSIFITDVTSSGGSAISDKNYTGTTSPANKIIADADSDGDVTIHVEVDAGPASSVGRGWQPAVTVRGGDSPVAVTLTQIDNSRRFSGTAVVSTGTPGDYTIYADATDGGRSQDITLTRTASPPLVLTAVIDNHSTTTGGDPHCPLAQTQVSSDDTLDISGTTESHANEVYVKDSDVTAGEGLQGPFTVTAGEWSGTINVGTGTASPSFYTCYAKVTGQSAGADKVSTESVVKDQTVPTFTGGTQSDIAYPGTQEALKDAETCTVTVTHTNADGGDTYLYDDNSTGELTIPSPTTYSAAKASVARLSGNYRESGTNYRLTATRAAKNGKSATKTVTVKIAHVLPTIVVTEPDTRLRSKTGSNKLHTITITSDQALKSAPSLSRDPTDTPVINLGAFSGGPLVWTAILQVREADSKNHGEDSFQWSSLSATNRAEKVQTTIDTTGANDDIYVIGGFEQRDIVVTEPYDRFESIGTGCTGKDNANLLVMEYVGLAAGVYEAAVNDTPGSLKFTITTINEIFSAFGNHIRCNDPNIYNPGADYTMRIEEKVS
jgi:hypothetical protein